MRFWPTTRWSADQPLGEAVGEVRGKPGQDHAQDRPRAGEARAVRDAHEGTRVALVPRPVVGVGPAPDHRFVQVSVETAVLLDEAVVVAEEGPGNAGLQEPAERCPPLAVVDEDHRGLSSTKDLVGQLERPKAFRPVDDNDISRED